MNRLFLFIFLSCIGFTTAEAFTFGDLKTGVEFELEGVGVAANNKDASNYIWLLEQVKAQYGGGEIQIRPWNKYTNAEGTFYAQMKDRKGRTWSVVPEIMNAGKFDGYELITPPLDSQEDGAKLENLLARLEKSNLYANGWSSSTHYTYDVSHLIANDGNISKFVDLILFLESNMANIYKVVNPKRYKQTVNGYAIPLGLNQKELLHELAQMPASKRTYSRVRAVFIKYHEREVSLVGDMQAWKYRSINYGKFFGLGHFKQLPVLEFRLSDLAGSKNATKLAEFFGTLIEVGSETPSRIFTDPLPNIDYLTKKRSENLDSYLKYDFFNSYSNFLKTVDLSPKKLPNLSKGYSKSLCRLIFF